MILSSESPLFQVMEQEVTSSNHPVDFGHLASVNKLIGQNANGLPEQQWGTWGKG
jgi:hypothetical protein